MDKTRVDPLLYLAFRFAPGRTGSRSYPASPRSCTESHLNCYLAVKTDVTKACKGPWNRVGQALHPEGSPASPWLQANLTFGLHAVGDAAASGTAFRKQFGFTLVQRLVTVAASARAKHPFPT